jgi:hypothetical protein
MLNSPQSKERELALTKALNAKQKSKTELTTHKLALTKARNAKERTNQRLS